MSKPTSGSDQDATGAEVTPTPSAGSGDSNLPAQAPAPDAGRHIPSRHQTNHLGLNPEMVIIQPPSPPPEPPTGRADENSVTKAQLAQQLEVSTRTVDRWVDEGILPYPIRLGRGRMATRFQADAALLYWQEQGEEARKERRHRQRNRRNRSQDSLTHESRRRRSGR